MTASARDRQMSLLNVLAEVYARREEAMVHPLRPFLLNRQITIEARKIAHAATKTCKPRPVEPKEGEPTPPEIEISGHDDDHTKNCNALTKHIVDLAMQVKLASMQPPAPRQTGDNDDEQADRDQTAANVD